MSLPDGTIRLNEKKYYELLRFLIKKDEKNYNNAASREMYTLIQIADIKENGKYRPVTAKEVLKYAEECEKK